MKIQGLLSSLSLTIGLTWMSPLALRAVEINWVAGDGDFFTGSNWDSGTPPGETDIAIISSGATVTIAANAGDRILAGIRLGPTQGSTESGHVIMEGGFLKLSGNSGDPKAVIGFSDTLSTFVMNGGTIYFDGPDQFPGIDETTKPNAGVNNLDWEVGEKGLGRFEMHNHAIFKGSDDLKIAENAAGSGSCLIDGNALLTLGSGISISSGGTVEQTMTIAGSAVVDVGNSMGAGNATGATDEGYLTMAIGGGHATLTIQENATLNIRRLSARAGTSTLVVKDHGQFNIFDVFRGAGGADRPPENRFNSSYATEGGAVGILTLQDDAVMSVSAAAALTEDPHSGLAIGGRRGATDAGGDGTLTIRDRASFRVEQDLAIGDGASAASKGSLVVIGPDAKVSIGGDLNLAYHAPLNAETLGTAIFNPVITGTAQAAVLVTGTARISFSILKVTLGGYTPVGGETYTLIKAGSFDGEFKEVDTTEAELAGGLSWAVDYSDPKAVKLRVDGAAQPRLDIVRAVVLSFPASAATYTLEAANLVEGPWTPVTANREVVGDQIKVTVERIEHQYYRLRKP